LAVVINTVLIYGWSLFLDHPVYSTYGPLRIVSIESEMKISTLGPRVGGQWGCCVQRQLCSVGMVRSDVNP
jgi:hypothetical protein